MILMKSTTSDGSLFQVMDGEKLIGLIRVRKDTTCEKYQALIYRPGQREDLAKEFYSPQDALEWIGKAYEQPG